jgi:hypothetical protein
MKVFILYVFFQRGKNTTSLRQKAGQLQKIFQNRILLFQTILPLFRDITLGILLFLPPVPRANARQPSSPDHVRFASLSGVIRISSLWDEGWKPTFAGIQRKFGI